MKPFLGRISLGPRVQAVIYRKGYGEYGMCGFTDVSYNKNADKAIELLSDICDGLAERFPSNFTETNCDGGVLEVETSIGKFVINKQAPCKQLWLSSPISGPHHYDMIASPKDAVHTLWKSKKDNHNLFSLLESEFSSLVKKQIAFDL